MPILVHKRCPKGRLIYGVASSKFSLIYFRNAYPVLLPANPLPIPGGGGREKNEIGTKLRRCSVRARGEGKGGEKNVSLNNLRPYHPRKTPMTRIVDDRYTLPVRYREPVMIEGPRRQGPDTNKRVSHENTIADDSGLSSCTRYRNGKKSTRNPSK